MPLVTDTGWTAELTELLREFFPGGDDVEVRHTRRDTEPKNIFTIGGKAYPFVSVFPDTRLNMAKRNAKLGLYDALTASTGRSLPWGSLTGVRPTKLFCEAVRCGMDYPSAERFMTDVYRVSAPKAALLRRIAEAQRGLDALPEKAVNLYVHIPFCRSRCTYCSFVSADADRHKKLIGPYVDSLVTELERGRRFLADNGYAVYSVYVGGGTPTAIPPESLGRVLAAAKYEGEFTCEAGRPDTIDDEAVDLMRRAGVTRVSVNPQSLCDETLRRIGRSHTVDDFYRAYETVKKAGFSVNTDLIAGLPGEDIGAFADTLSGIVRLRPDNVTVHTLARKNGSELKNQPYAPSDEVAEMVDLAGKILTALGYMPYYLYRQKNMEGNLENVGYTLPGKRCVNNITTMEDTLSVFACGAGAISKRVTDGGRQIARSANVRDVGLYIAEFGERLAKKERFFAPENG